MTCRLIYASTKNSDMLYAVKTNIPDDFLFLEIGKEKFVFLDQRELGVFKENSTDKKLKAVAIEPFIKNLNSHNPAQLIFSIIQKYAPNQKQFEVPACFRLDIAEFLRSQGITLKIVNPFLPKRLVKNSYEIKAIENSLKKTATAFKKIEDILKKSIIKNNFIIFEGVVLTSEFIKKEVDLILLKQDMLNTEGIIISSGEQASIPHHTGSGPLLPHKPIICDIFPKDRATGYFGDITRTYVKGHASKEMKKIYESVLKSQMTGIAAVKPGISGREIHKICYDSFQQDNYETGFIHNTGHGLGLDIHELPYLSNSNNEPLVPGNIITIEPGLYYKNKGSARIEDVLVVTKTGSCNLTNYPKFLEIL